MSSKRMDLNKRSFFVLSGLSNPLGKTLALEMCRRFECGSVAMLIETSEELLQEVKKEIQFLEHNIEVICCVINSWQQVNAVLFRQLFDTALASYPVIQNFDSAIILHNEGTGATQKLLEPQDVANWKLYVQENLNAVVTLNQQFIQLPQITSLPKLVINISASIMVQPFNHSGLICSCKKARDMYFRAMANKEHGSKISVINYGPGLLESHKHEYDANNNVVDLMDLEVPQQLAKLPRVTAQQSVHKLINILEESSFISGHDVDYFDTYVL